MPPESTADQDQLEDRRPVAALTTASNHPAVVGEDLGYLLSSTPNIDLSTIRLIPNEDGTVGIAGRVGPVECPSCHAAGHPCTEYCQAENREYPGQPGERRRVTTFGPGGDNVPLDLPSMPLPPMPPAEDD